MKQSAVSATKKIAKKINFKKVSLILFASFMCFVLAATGANAAETDETEVSSTTTVSSSVSSENTSSVTEDDESDEAEDDSEEAAASAGSTAVASSVNSITETDTDIDGSADVEEAVNYSFSSTTVGNAELVADEEILLDTGYYQFIAITTRDGDIFYIIIDETKTEDNVYFLNEVDTLDIEKLVGEDTDISSVSTSTSTSYDNEEVEEETIETSSNTSSGNSQFNLILCVGAVALCGIGFAIYKLRGNKKPANNNSDNPDDGFEYEDDEDE